MKNLLLFLFLTTCSSTMAIAQNCNGVDEKKDAFTGKTERSAAIKFADMYAKWLINMDQIDGATYMIWNIAMSGEYNQQLPVGIVLKLRLENGSVLSLKSIEPTAPVTKLLEVYGGPSKIFSTYILKYSLSKTDLTELSKSSIEELKFDVPGLNITNPKIKGKQVGKLQEVAGCLLITF